jgi:hypothetical protein
MFMSGRGVHREAHDEPGVGHDAVVAPVLEHLTVLGNAVLLLLGGGQVVRVDAFQADEGVGAAGPLGLLDELGDLVAQRVHLDQESQVQTLFAQFDQAVEDRLPVPVAGEVVVGDEETMDTLGRVGPDQALDVVVAPVAGLAALDVDDGAEAALEGAAPAGVEGADHAVVPAHHGLGQEGGHLVLQARQVVQEVVDRLQAPFERVAEDPVQAPLGLAGEEADALVQRLLQVRR